MNDWAQKETEPPPLKIVHVERPLLPWRDEDLTECGLSASNHPTITRDELKVKVKREGKTRALYTTCQTCFATAQRHPTWEEDPVGRVQREVNLWGRDDKYQRVRQELEAIALLIEAHRGEFDQTMQDLDGAVDLSDRRAKRAQRRRLN